MQDELGERMKGQYEHRTRFFVPRRTYTIIRLDGKAFHTYTRGLTKPFDVNLYEDMDKAIIAMLPHIQGAVFAYTQSDEISVLVTDFALPTTSAWFDGNIQKMASVSSSIITAEFNKFRWDRYIHKQSMELLSRENTTAYFDSRIFTIPDRTEVMNYFIWRNQDCSRNAVSMVAQSQFSHKELQGKSTPMMQEMLFTQKGINWSEYDEALKNGRLIVKESYFHNAIYNVDVPVNKDGITVCGPGVDGPARTRWASKPAWKFTQDKEKLMEMIPQYL
jgi:tRNA(His) 5'-end guanylyltransferase